MPSRKKRKAAAAAEEEEEQKDAPKAPELPAPAEDKEEEQEDEDAPAVENEYELARQRLIARNRERLLALGIEDAIRGLSALAPPPPPPPKKKQKKQERSSEPAAPSRRSDRARGIKAEPAGDAAEEAERQLARRRRIKEEEEEEEDPDAAAAARQARLAARGMTEAERMTHLELGGLVDFTDSEAVFIVVGSTGKHYCVRFKDRRAAEDGGGGGGGKSKKKDKDDGAEGKMVATCECMDHRCRKRDCKHIKLSAKEVGGGLFHVPAASGGAGFVDHDADWRAAVRASIERLGRASDADVAAVRRKDAARRQRQRQGKKKQEAEEEEEEGKAGAAPTAAAAAAALAEQRLASRGLKGALAFM